MAEPRHHTVQVPATSANLGAGFDAFGLAVDRYLTVRSSSRDAQPSRVGCLGEGAGDLPTTDDNLIWRSLVGYCDEVGAPVPDIALRARSAIPLERGMGSSSAAIVAGLCLGRALTATRLGDRELVCLATEIEGHPDNVAPALLGGLVACAVADGGGLVVRRINPTPALRPVLLVPATRQSTGAARAVVPTQLSRAAAVDQAARAGHVLAGLAGAWPVDARVSGDRLHEPPRLEVMGPSAGVLRDLRAAGVHAWLSGAGPSIAAFVAAPGTGPGALLADVAARHDFRVEPLAVELAGALACPDDGCALAGTGGCVQCPRRRL